MHPDPFPKYILDDNGEPVRADLLEWAQWFVKSPARQLAYDELNGGTRVSTAFLGVGEILWETLVRRGDVTVHQERHKSRTAALAAHARWVTRSTDVD